NRSEEIRLVLPGFSIDLRDKNLIGLFFPTDFGPFRPTQNGPFCPPLTFLPAFAALRFFYNCIYTACFTILVIGCKRYGLLFKP
ncbi:MAG: hypothetical protein PUE98_00360, partial [Galactobacillus timonensis]|uniref:hypothetical protein n=1 Tax=Galactobacillus timonensis TaxID=2041840 RepID=UPI00240A9675